MAEKNKRSEPVAGTVVKTAGSVLTAALIVSGAVGIVGIAFVWSVASRAPRSTP